MLEKIAAYRADPDIDLAMRQEKISLFFDEVASGPGSSERIVQEIKRRLYEFPSDASANFLGEMDIEGHNNDIENRLPMTPPDSKDTPGKRIRIISRLHIERKRSVMLNALMTIIKENWEWRDQIRRLAVFELLKKARGTALGWAWLFIKPGTYLFCFWFALEIGLRSGSPDPSAPPFFLWLCAGMIPWFFMQDELGLGVDTFHRYPYLVNKIKFPICGIPMIYTIATLFLQLMLMVALFIIYFLSGMKPDIYLLQVPLLLVMMVVFWYIASTMFSLLSGMSKDFANLMSALSTPFFWLSGAIFDVSSIDNAVIQGILDYNPITFFINAFRDTFYYKTWFWENTSACIGFAIVFVITLVVMLWLYKKLHKEVADVL